MEHVLNDLVNNAIKFTDHGSVNLSLCHDSQSTSACVQIKVIDTGIGIPKSQQAMIFDAFRQASEGYERSYEGTGLGLTISRCYVELLGGRISLQSEPGKGSEFCISFPAQSVQEELAEQEVGNMPCPPPIIPAPEPRKVLPRVLMIDDDVTSHKLVDKMLEDRAIIDCAFSGEDGIKLARKGEYKLVLLDIHLGAGINGLAVVNAIRSIPCYQDIPIIAITAYSMVGDKETFLSMGFSHYLSKPFSQKDLVHIIDMI